MINGFGASTPELPINDDEIVQSSFETLQKFIAILEVDFPVVVRIDRLKLAGEELSDPPVRPAAERQLVKMPGLEIFAHGVRFENDRVIGSVLVLGIVVRNPMAIVVPARFEHLTRLVERAVDTVSVTRMGVFPERSTAGPPGLPPRRSQGYLRPATRRSAW